MFEVLHRTKTHHVHFSDGGVGVTHYNLDDLETIYSKVTKQQAKFLIEKYGDKAVELIWNAQRNG